MEFQLVQQIMKDEISRDRWLAVQAAERLGAGESASSKRINKLEQDQGDE